jgi:hypothetical protein
MTGRAAFPLTSSAFAIACREQRGESGTPSGWLLGWTNLDSGAGSATKLARLSRLRHMRAPVRCMGGASAM